MLERGAAIPEDLRELCTRRCAPPGPPACQRFRSAASSSEGQSRLICDEDARQALPMSRTPGARRDHSCQDPDRCTCLAALLLRFPPRHVMPPMPSTLLPLPVTRRAGAPGRQQSG